MSNTVKTVRGTATAQVSGKNQKAARWPKADDCTIGRKQVITICNKKI